MRRMADTGAARKKGLLSVCKTTDSEGRPRPHDQRLRPTNFASRCLACRGRRTGMVRRPEDSKPYRVNVHRRNPRVPAAVSHGAAKHFCVTLRARTPLGRPRGTQFTIPCRRGIGGWPAVRFLELALGRDSRFLPWSGSCHEGHAAMQWECRLWLSAMVCFPMGDLRSHRPGTQCSREVRS